MECLHCEEEIKGEEHVELHPTGSRYHLQCFLTAFEHRLEEHIYDDGL